MLQDCLLSLDSVENSTVLRQTRQRAWWERRCAHEVLGISFAVTLHFV
jgi:hypothetical protein